MICFHIYHLIARCTVHVKCPLDKNKICRLCLRDSVYVSHAKLYKQIYIVMMETYTSDFHTSF